MKTIVAIAFVLFLALVLPDASNSIVVVTRPRIPPHARVIRGHFEQPRQRPNPAGWMAGRRRQVRGSTTGGVHTGDSSNGSVPPAALHPGGLPTADLATKLQGISTAVGDASYVVGNSAAEGIKITANAAGDQAQKITLDTTAASKQAIQGIGGTSITGLPIVPVIITVEGTLNSAADVVRGGLNAVGDDAIRTGNDAVAIVFIASLSASDVLSQAKRHVEKSRKTRGNFHSP